MIYTVVSVMYSAITPAISGNSNKTCKGLVKDLYEHWRVGWGKLSDLWKALGVFDKSLA